jgi:rfaE bifunctional protein kinase chain/domain/rfaE bifunctional protein nucleotidyltransferase chain/domain
VANSAATTKAKIASLTELAAITREARKRNQKVVHCHGVFDLLHIGHVRYLEQAKSFGDILIVTITPDRFVDKGPHRPAFTESLRVEAVASLGCVNYAAINEWPTAVETLRLLQPHIYVKGSEFKTITSDMTGKMELEAEVVREIGAELKFAEDIVFSSTRLINQYLSIYPSEVQEYLDLFRRRHSLDSVLEAIDRMASLKVLVVGDSIIDEYVYGEAIGKSSKDPVIAIRYQSEDRFAGGALAVANHVASFAGHVEIMTVLGGRNPQEDFIRSRLSANVTPNFYFADDIPTVSKRRIIEGYSLTKLIEIYDMDDRELPAKVTESMCQMVRERAKDFDLVLVSDFGHGAITKTLVQALCDHSPFLAVNTQANAGNRGFHTITRYPRADYACIAEHELRLETRDARSDLRPLLEQTQAKLGARYMVVTTGRKGCMVGTRNQEFIAVPALAKKVVDRVGAGDAFLSISALAAAQGVPFEILGFIGNLAGAEAVEIVGNDKAVDKLKLRKHLVSLLK